MEREKYFVVSDLHLGNNYFCHRAFIAWLDQLPLHATLVLNDDVLDSPKDDDNAGLISKGQFSDDNSSSDIISVTVKINTDKIEKSRKPLLINPFA